LAANAYTGLVMLVMFAYCLLRIPLEEKMLVDHFGQAYQNYRARTGAILPRLYPVKE